MATLNIFTAFDGSNKHKDYDQLVKLGDPADDRRSNVAKLFELARSNPNTLALYEKGVGTRTLTQTEIDAVEAGLAVPEDYYSDFELAIAVGEPFDANAQGLRDQVDGMLTQLELPIENAIASGDTIIIDGTAFSRGVAAMRSFINELRARYPDLIISGQLQIRNVIFFDGVSSYIANDGNNPGFNIDLNADSAEWIFQYKSNDTDESRANFGVSSLRDKDGNLEPNMGEITVRGDHSDNGGGRSYKDDTEIIVVDTGTLKTGAEREAHKAEIEATAETEGYEVIYQTTNEAHPTVADAFGVDPTVVRYSVVKTRRVKNGLDNVYLADAARRFSENGTQLNDVSDLGADSQVPTDLNDYRNSLANDEDLTQYNDLLDEYVHTPFYGEGGRLGDWRDNFAYRQDSDGIRDVFVNEPNKAVDVNDPGSFDNSDSWLDLLLNQSNQLESDVNQTKNNTDDLNQLGNSLSDAIKNISGIISVEIQQNNLSADDTANLHHALSSLLDAQNELNNAVQNNQGDLYANSGAIENNYGETVRISTEVNQDDSGLLIYQPPENTSPNNHFIIDVDVDTSNHQAGLNDQLGQTSNGVGLLHTGPAQAITALEGFVNNDGLRWAGPSATVTDMTRPGNHSLSETQTLIDAMRAQSIDASLASLSNNNAIPGDPLLLTPTNEFRLAGVDITAQVYQDSADLTIHAVLPDARPGHNFVTEYGVEYSLTGNTLLIVAPTEDGSGYKVLFVFETNDPAGLLNTMFDLENIEYIDPLVAEVDNNGVGVSSLLSLEDSQSTPPADISQYSSGILSIHTEFGDSLLAIDPKGVELDLSEISDQNQTYNSIIGGIGNDQFTGTDSDDWLIGKQGSDTFDSGAGRDVLVIDADDKMQNIDAGSDIDTIIIADERGVFLNLHETNSELVFGGYGNDTLVGGGADNFFINGGAGDDLIIGGSADDALNAEDGNDVVSGGAGDDLIRGHRGEDTLFGASGNDILNGGHGNDKVYGDAGGDVIYASQGDDIINGGDGIDIIQLTGELHDYHFDVHQDGSITITDSVDNRDGTEAIKHIEKFAYQNANSTTTLEFAAENPIPIRDTLNVDNVSGAFLVSIDALISNDIDFQNDSLTITEVGDAIGGSVRLVETSDGSTPQYIEFTPDEHFTGVYRFHYLLEDAKGNASPRIAQANNPSIEGLMKGDVRIIDASFNLPVDPEFANQWYLDEANIIDVWSKYSGNNIDVVVIEPSSHFATSDEYVDFTHPDLFPNAHPNFDTNDKDVSNHATQVAGVIGAARNNTGIVGVAYNATLDSISLGADDRLLNDFLFRLGRMADYDIANNSWAYNDFYLQLPEVEQTGIETAFNHAIHSGRDGKGTILVFSAGNDREKGHDTALSPVSGAHGIVVGSYNKNADIGAGDNPVTAFSNPGSNVLISAPGSHIHSSSIQYQNANGSLFGSETNVTQGTSFSTPIVSGVVALMLEANPDLSYRDVQQILALSAVKINNTDGWSNNHASNWNGQGMHFNRDYGFGQLDALTAVRFAENWESLDAAESRIKSSNTLNSVIADNALTTHSLHITDNLQLETVELDLSLDHTRWSDLKISLISPSNTESILLDRPGIYAGEIISESANNELRLNVSSVHFRGESSVGNWTIKIHDHVSGENGVLNDWSLNLQGSLKNEDDQYYFTPEYADQAVIHIDDQAGINTFNAGVIDDDITLDLSRQTNSAIQNTSINLSPETIFQNIYSGGGNDHITADEHNNFIISGIGDDVVFAGVGNDVIYTGDGNNTVTGGTGRDIYVFDSEYQGTTIIKDFSVDAFEKIGFIAQSDELLNQITFTESGNNTVLEFNGNSIVLENIALDDFQNSSLIHFSQWQQITNLTEIPEIPSTEDNLPLPDFSINRNTIYVGLEQYQESVPVVGEIWRNIPNSPNWHLRHPETTYPGVSLSYTYKPLTTSGGTTNIIYNNIGTKIVDRYRVNQGTDAADILYHDINDNPDSNVNSDDRRWQDGSYIRELHGYAGDDIIYGDQRVQVIEAGADDDFVYAGGGNDLVDGDFGNDILLGEAGDDRLTGGSGIDHLSGGVGDDILEADSGNDVLIGNTGNDSLEGGSGNDIYIYSAGDGRDTIVEYDTNNILYLNELTLENVSITANLVHTIDEIYTSFAQLDFSQAIPWQQVDQLLSIDLNIRHGLTDQVIIKDWFEQNPFSSYVFNNEQSYLASQINLSRTNQPASNTADVILSVESDTDMNFHALEGDDTIFSSTGNDVLYGGEGKDLLDGSAGHDNLFGNTGDDILIGGDGNDTLDGGAGDDILWAGTGADTIYFNSGADILLDALDPEDTLVFSELSTDEIDVDIVHEDGKHLISFRHATIPDDSLKLFEISDDTKLSFADIDTIDAHSFISNKAISVNPIEDIHVDEWHVIDIKLPADTFQHNMADSIFYSITHNNHGQSIDWLDIDADRLRFTGRPEGNDVGQYEFAITATDSLGYSKIQNFNLIVNNKFEEQYGTNGNDLLLGTSSNDGLFGFDGHDELHGGDGDDVLDGGGSNDILHGGNGNDIFFVDHPDDVVIENSNHNSENDTVITIVNSGHRTGFFNYTLPVNVENLQLADNGYDSRSIYQYGYGNTADNTLTAGTSSVMYGREGDDLFIDDGGRDMMVGGSGADTYLFDITQYEYSQNQLHVDQHDTIKIYGVNSFDELNIEIGQWSEYWDSDQDDWDYWNKISSGQALGILHENNHLMLGVAGDWNNETFKIQLIDHENNITHITNQMLKERLMGGTEQDDVLYGLDSNDDIYGREGDDVLYGGLGNDHLFGGEGNDAIYGETSTINVLNNNDHLYGGGGDDFLQGGRGDDTYYYQLGDGNDTILDKLYTTSGGNDTLKLIDISTDDVRFKPTFHYSNYFNLSYELRDLEIEILATGEVITLQHYFRSHNSTGRYSRTYSQAKLENISLLESSDSSEHMVLDYDDILAGFSKPGNGHDVLLDDSGVLNHLLDGGSGNDLLRGFDGNDTYVFAPGYDHDTIDDSFAYFADNTIDTLYVNGDRDSIVIENLPNTNEYRLRFANNNHDSISFHTNEGFNAVDIDQIKFTDSSEQALMHNQIDNFISAVNNFISENGIDSWDHAVNHSDYSNFLDSLNVWATPV